MKVKSEFTKEFIYSQVIRRRTHIEKPTTVNDPGSESPAEYTTTTEGEGAPTSVQDGTTTPRDEVETPSKQTPMCVNGSPQTGFNNEIELGEVEINATESQGALLEAIKEYTNDVLNDSHTPQTAVYKAIFHSSGIEFVVHFYLYREYGLGSSVLRGLRRRHERFLHQHGLFIHSERILEQIDAFKRKPIHIGEEPDQHWGNVRGSNLCTKFINWWLIVPRVQLDFFNLLYQMYTFDITHQGFIPKFVHFFTIPCNVMLFMTWLAQFGFLTFGRFGYGAYQVNASTVAFLILAAAYIVMGLLRKTLAWGVATTVVIMVCTLTGNLWYTVYATPGNPWYNPMTWGSNPIIWSYIISFIQASSHLFEKQIPPYITGLKHWETAHRFFCKRWRESDNCLCSWQFILLSCACFPIFSVLVAWFSWYHLIGTEVIYLMAGIGYQHSSFTKYFRVIEKATLTGNPGLDTFPVTDKDLEHTRRSFVRSSIGRRLSRYGIIRDDATDMEVTKSVCTMQIVSKYFKQPTVEEDFECMNAAKKQFQIRL